MPINTTTEKLICFKIFACLHDNVTKHSELVSKCIGSFPAAVYLTDAIEHLYSEEVQRSSA